MSSSTLDRVTRIIAQAAGLGSGDKIDANTSLIGSGISLDSAAVLEILVGIEKEFGVEIDVDELMSRQALGSVSALADFVDSKASTAP
jgi:acyl carrier protein